MPFDDGALSLILSRCVCCLVRVNWLSTMGCLIAIVYSLLFFLYFEETSFFRSIQTTTQLSYQAFVFWFLPVTYSFAFCSFILKKCHFQHLVIVNCGSGLFPIFIGRGFYSDEALSS